MPRSVPIRIRKKDEQEYRRLVRNTRAKIRRVKKTHNRDLESIVEIPKLEEFKTRKEYNQFKKNMLNFTSRQNREYQYIKNEYGVSLAKVEIDVIKEKTKMAQENYDKAHLDVGDVKMRRRGKEIGTTVRQQEQLMADPDIGGIRPRDFNINNYKDMIEVKREMKRLERDSQEGYYDWRIDVMKDNFIAKLEYTFNSEADMVVDTIKRMPNADFLALARINKNGVMDFSLYDSERSTSRNIETSIDMDENLAELHTLMQEYEAGEIDFDFETLGKK